MGDMYKSTGEEKLRGDPQTFDGEDKAEADRGAGKDAGGTDNLKADHKVLTAKIRDAVPPQETVDRPPDVQQFDDDMGRVNLWQNRGGK